MGYGAQVVLGFYRRACPRCESKKDNLKRTRCAERATIVCHWDGFLRCGALYVEGAVLIVERWILVRLRRRSLFIAELNTAIGILLEISTIGPMRQFRRSRRQVFEEIERAALAPLPGVPFEYAEWKPPRCIRLSC